MKVSIFYKGVSKMVHLIQHSIKHTLRTKHVIKEVHTHCRKVQKDKKGTRNGKHLFRL